MKARSQCCLLGYQTVIKGFVLNELFQSRRQCDTVHAIFSLRTIICSFCDGECHHCNEIKGDAKINVLTISQGRSEGNISAVVSTSQSTRALRALDAAFQLSHTTVGVVGMNEVGKSLLRLLEAWRRSLITTFEVDLQVCTVSMESQDTDCLCLTNEGGDDSITMAVVEKAISCNTSHGSSSITSFDSEMPGDVNKAFYPDLSQFLGNLFREDNAHHVVFDCTNDEEASKYHAEWLLAGVHVVTANNTGLSGTKELPKAIDANESAHGKLSAKYFRDVTVGGGLPFIDTLRTLLSSGDKIRRVDGIFSVSMSYIMYRISPPPKSAECDRFDEKMTGGVFRGEIALHPGVSLDKACSFSQALEEAVSLGLIKNDSGHDVGNEYSTRVMMVLAKILGFDRNPSTKAIQARTDKLAESLGGNLDEAIYQRVSAAAERDCVLRHIGSIDVASQSVDIKIVEVPKNHIFAVTPPTCECVRFFTQRYQPYPFVMQGSAAGADCTSSALLAEVLSLVSSKIGPKSGSLSRTGSSAYLK